MRIKRNTLTRIIVESIERVMTDAPVKFRLDKISRLTAEDSAINEETVQNTDFILRKSSWDENDYGRFLEIVEKTPKEKKGFLTRHGIEEISQPDWVTYTLKGYDVAFALHLVDLEKGSVDICNLVNNDPRLKGVGKKLLTFAKQEGGTQMDNYRGENGSHGFLGDLYRKSGFDRQTWSDTFNPDYQPEDPEWRFDTNTYGTPDVEGLERSKHRTRMSAYNPRKKKFQDRLKTKFKVKDEQDNNPHTPRLP
jgi:hypothetical protein